MCVTQKYILLAINRLQSSMSIQIHIFLFAIGASPMPSMYSQCRLPQRINVLISCGGAKVCDITPDCLIIPVCMHGLTTSS